jgi:hypothetical protein
MDAYGWLEREVNLLGDNGEDYHYKVHPRLQYYCVISNDQWYEPSVYPRNGQVIQVLGMTFTVHQPGVRAPRASQLSLDAVLPLMLCQKVDRDWGLPVADSELMGFNAYFSPLYVRLHTQQVSVQCLQAPDSIHRSFRDGRYRGGYQVPQLRRARATAD